MAKIPGVTQDQDGAIILDLAVYDEGKPHWLALPKPTKRHAPVVKYSPDQPRDPAGTPTGGQWTAGSGSGGTVEAESKPGPTVPAEQSDPKWEDIGNTGARGDHYVSRQEPSQPSFTESEQQAIANYTASGYYRINSALWRGQESKLDKDETAVMTTMDRLTQASLDKPADVWRGMFVKSAWIEDNMKPGTILLHKGFVSASMDTSRAVGALSTDLRNFKARENIMLRIPGVTQGLFPGGDSRFPEEKEIILPRGTRLRVDADEGVVSYMKPGLAGYPPVKARTFRVTVVHDA